MPATQQSLTMTSLLTTSEADLLTSFPPLSKQLKNIIDTRFEEDRPIKPFTTPSSSTLTADEQSEILEKVRQLSQLPGLTFDTETQLYLEQQLADLLSIEVSNNTESLSLPFVKGRIESLAHLRSFPGQDSNTEMSVPEAGIQPTRSVFGWQMPQSDTEQNQLSEYWVALSLRSIVSDQLSMAEIKQLTFKKKILVINPTEALYAIAQILDDYEDVSHKYQLGGSPQLIREGLFWSPQNNGSVLVFLIPDATATAPGVYSLVRDL